MNIIQKYIPIGTKRRSGEQIKGVRYIVCHDTANDGASAMANVKYYINSANDESASAHAFVDADGVIECMPLREKAWHVRYNAGIAPNITGNFANDYALGVELCYSTKGIFDSIKAYNNYVEYIRSLCATYKLDPHTALVTHAQLDPTRRTDPLNAFGFIHKTWEQFITDVAGMPPLPIPDPLVKIDCPQSKVEKVLAYIKTI